MKKILFTTGTVLLAAAMPLLADDATATASASVNTNENPPPAQLFRANEVSLDLFGGDSLSEHTVNHPSEQRVLHHSTLDAGAGLNYFFLRYLGIGGEGYTENTRHNFVDDADGYVILRIPIGETGLAPYALGGAGHKFDPQNVSYADGGVGLEFRFTHHFGVFADARYVYADKYRIMGWAGLGSASLFKRRNTGSRHSNAVKNTTGAQTLEVLW